MRMTLVRTIAVSGFVADANPNVTPPVAAQLFDAQAAGAGDQAVAEPVEGLRMCLRAVDNSNVEQPTATCNFTVWQKDDGATADLGRDAYISLKAETAAPSSGSYACALKGGKIFVQVTALSAAAATKFLLYAEAATSVPG